MLDFEGKGKTTLLSGGAASPDTPEPPGGLLARAKPDARSRSLIAPAKVNLRLKVVGRRPDGYHELRMVMVKLDLADEIELETDGGEIRMECDNVHLPADPSNTIWRAADLVREESGKRFGLKARLKKRIPVAAGLGGGSSDAAQVLTGLNSLLGLGWDQKRLMELGLKVGADVPFFLAEGPQTVSGIGEILEPIKISVIPLILINPGFPLRTADAYRWYDESAMGAGPVAPSSPGSPRFAAVWRGAPSGRTTRSHPGLTGIMSDASLPPLENDLEGVVIPRYPVLGRLKELLIRAGALGTLMSGSGPTVFGRFESTESRDRGYEILLRDKDPRWWICKATSL